MRISHVSRGVVDLDAFEWELRDGGHGWRARAMVAVLELHEVDGSRRLL